MRKIINSLLLILAVGTGTVASMDLGDLCKIDFFHGEQTSPFDFIDMAGDEEVIGGEFLDCCDLSVAGVSYNEFLATIDCAIEKNHLECFKKLVEFEAHLVVQNPNLQYNATIWNEIVFRVVQIPNLQCLQLFFDTYGDRITYWQVVGWTAAKNTNRECFQWFFETYEANLELTNLAQIVVQNPNLQCIQWYFDTYGDRITCWVAATEFAAKNPNYECRQWLANYLQNQIS